MHVHLVGVSGTGMGALAVLFREAGHDVSGSDASFDPPIGPALEAAGVRCQRGFDPAHLEPVPDLIVVGNVIRRDNPEAVAIRERNLKATSMSGALRETFLRGRRPLIVSGTHGKTTTSAMCAWILACAELDPGYFIGGLPKNFPSGAAIGSTKRRLIGGGRPAPFVVEGDEYDAVYWHKQPKFLDYVGASEDDVVIVTSVEHDHIDIYPDDASYDAAFIALARATPKGGLIVCDAGQRRAADLMATHASARVAFYALQGDETGPHTPSWLGAPSTINAAGMQTFDLYAGGVSCGRFAMKSPGAHNVRNAVAAIAACAEGFNVPITTGRTAMATFEGVRRRQDLIGEPGGVRVYDDFAHHPTAVTETLGALRARHPAGKLFAVFEPRSATACRSIHQDAYSQAFSAADRVLLAPLGRTNIPDAERLDLGRLARELGEKAVAADSVDTILARVVAEAHAGDTVALLSNGAFAGLHARLLTALSEKSLR
jgi:UDP-N-acetylmuramate: L-alanyl-gamma-D-glutamyl-meso-diaminopimelate ligase